MKVLKYILMNPEEVAGGSEPASTPSSAEPTATSSAQSFETPDFSSIVDAGYGDEPVSTQISSAPAAGTQVQAPVSQPAPAPSVAPTASGTPTQPNPSAAPTPPVPAPGQTPIAQPQAAPAASTPAQPQAASSPSVAPSAQPAQGPFDLDALRTNTLPQLESLYALSEQEVAEYEASPATALPKLAAKLHFEATMAAYGSVMNVLPQIINAGVQHALAARDQDQAFYTRWPQLRGQESTVMQTLQAWRQVNPQASSQDLVEKAGAMAMLALGLDPRGTAQPAPTHAPAPAPHRPAGPSATGAMQQVFGQPDNIFEAIANEHLSEMGLPGR